MLYLSEDATRIPRKKEVRKKDKRDEQKSSTGIVISSGFIHKSRAKGSSTYDYHIQHGRQNG